MTNRSITGEFFQAEDLMERNKVELLPYVRFDLMQCVEYGRRVNSDMLVLPVSATVDRSDGKLKAPMPALKVGLRGSL